jgi:hypothetical protein
MENLFMEIVKNPVFNFIGAVCSMIGAIVGILAVIPATRKKIFYNVDIALGKQSIDGDGNTQTGRNIGNHQNSDNNENVYKHIKIGKQDIKGNNNRQAGGDING